MSAFRLSVSAIALVVSVGVFANQSNESPSPTCLLYTSPSPRD